MWLLYGDIASQVPQNMAFAGQLWHVSMVHGVVQLLYRILSGLGNHNSAGTPRQERVFGQDSQESFRMS